MSATSITLASPIHQFADLSREAVSVAGGKGANLGELTRAGLPVPGGFVVGAPAYAAFCDADGLRETLAADLDELDVDDTESASFAGMNETYLLGAPGNPEFAVGAITEDGGAVLNAEAARGVHMTYHLATIEGASHLFEEPGTLEAVAQRAADWFAHHLTAVPRPCVTAGA